MSPGIDARANEGPWTESCCLDGVSGDGQRGFLLRVQRCPDCNTSWLRSQACATEGVFAYNDEYLRCPADRREEGGDELRCDYSLPIYADRRPATLVAGRLAGRRAPGVRNDFTGPSDAKEPRR